MLWFQTIAKEIRRAWADSAPLTATSLIMLGAFLGSLMGLLLDPRLITGAPAWLKPAKFAISTAIFAGTLAWLCRYIDVWPRFVRAMGWVVSVVLILEVSIIDLQAARGVASHFNVTSTLNGVLFSVMGTSIAVLWLASIGLLVALFRQKFSNPGWGWWLRMGMLVTVVGAASGGIMTRPTSEQMEAMQTGKAIRAVGAHTVGAPDGGDGLPGFGWSKQHGDLRIPHFFGLHGLQILPFLGWVLSRRNRQPGDAAVGLAIAATGSYLTFIGILTWQALRGQSIVAPDSSTLLAFGAWLMATAIVYVNLVSRRADSCCTAREVRQYPANQ